MAKKPLKVSFFENASIVKLKSNDRQIRLLARHDNEKSVYVSWYYEYLEETDLDSNLIAREDEMYLEN